MFHPETYKQNMGLKLKKGHVSNQLTNSPSRTIDETCIKIGPPKKKNKKNMVSNFPATTSPFLGVLDHAPSHTAQCFVL